jgi:hypothetical protein
MAFYSTLEDIKAGFFDGENPNWELHNGKPAVRPTGGTRYKTLIAESEDGDSMEQSWQRLENALDRISAKGGNAIVYIGDKEEDPVFSIPISLSTKTSSRGPGSSQEGPYRYNQLAGLGLPYDIKTAIEKERELWELKKTVEELQAGTGSVWEQIGQKIIESVDVNALISGLMGFASQVSGKGQNSPQAEQQPPTMSIQKPDTEASPGATIHDEEIEDKVDNLLDELEKHMDKQEMRKFLDNITQVVKTNPGMLKSLK